MLINYLNIIMMIFLIIKKLMALLMNLFTNQQITQIASQLFMISITSKKLNLLQVQKSLRALYLVFALLLILGVVFNFKFFHWVLPTYFVACAFFKTEPLLKVLNKLGFTPTEL